MANIRNKQMDIVWAGCCQLFFSGKWALKEVWI